MAGHLSLHSAFTTGESFFSDGAGAASSSLGTQLGLLTSSQQALLTPGTLWSRNDVLGDFFNKTPVPDVGAIWAHYSHWVAQPASLSSPPVFGDFLTTADVSQDSSHPTRVGCSSPLAATAG